MIIFRLKLTGQGLGAAHLAARGLRVPANRPRGAGCDLTEVLVLASSASWTPDGIGEQSGRLHTLVVDGVFSETRPGHLTCHPALPPSDEDVAQVLAIVRARVGQLLARRQVEPADDTAPLDPQGLNL